MARDDQKSGPEKLREALESRDKLKIPNGLPDLGAPDKDAEKEANALASGDLENEAARNEHDRTENFRNHVAKGLVIVFWIVFICVILAGLIWFWHLITPEKWHFLSDNQSDRIGGLLLGGATSKFLSGYATKKLT